ncbi:MAG: M50 family metallopeptidase [Candidatus Dormibacteria bacterium]
MSVLAVVAVVAVFGLLVTFHELGHFLVAKLNHVRVIEFAIGFGPTLVSFTGGETTYALRVVPLGGFVRLAGMDDGETGPRSFPSKNVWQRLSIIAAGSMVNLVVLPLLIFTGLQAMEAGGPVTVDSVRIDSPAAAHGILPDDLIVGVQGRDVSTVEDFRRAVNGTRGEEVTVIYRHPGAPPTAVRIVPESSGGKWIVGVGLRGGAFDPLLALTGSAKETVGTVVAIFAGLGALASGHIPGGLGGPCGPSGPVGILRATAAAAQEGVIALAGFTAFLSVNLGILNLLPIPALDGGRLAFLLVEAVRGKPIDPSKEQRVHFVGLVVLLSFVLFVSYNDFIRFGIPFSSLVSRCSG